MGMSAQNSTRFASLTPLRTALILIMFFTAIIYGTISYNPPPTPSDQKGEDLNCYRRIIERIHSGEGYYRAAGSELRGRGYPVRSVFNWRLPFLAWLLGHLPNLLAGQVSAIVLALITFLLWLRILDGHYSFIYVAVGSLLILAPPIYSFLPGVFLAHEFWAGTCIALSLGAYIRGWRLVSVIAGLGGLFIRELTLPFVIIMLVLAYIEGRRFEAAAWGLGIMAFAAAIFIHWSIVSKLINDGDFALEGGWIVFGGWNFALSTAQMHPYLFLAPPWVTAILLPMSLLGLAGLRDPLWVRLSLTINLYVLVFLIVGNPFNKYWGFMYTNLLLLGLLNISHSLLDLWGRVHRNPRTVIDPK